MNHDIIKTIEEHIGAKLGANVKVVVADMGSLPKSLQEAARKASSETASELVDGMIGDLVKDLVTSSLNNEKEFIEKLSKIAIEHDKHPIDTLLSINSLLFAQMCEDKGVDGEKQLEACKDISNALMKTLIDNGYNDANDMMIALGMAITEVAKVKKEREINQILKGSSNLEEAKRKAAELCGCPICRANRTRTSSETKQATEPESKVVELFAQLIREIRER